VTPRYYTTAAFARLTGLSRRLVRDRCARGYYSTRAGRLPGGHYEIIASELDRELRRKQTTTGPSR
jgi:hypothetical protein